MANEDTGEVREEKPRLAPPELLMDRDIIDMLVNENHEYFTKLIFPIVKRWVVGNYGNVTVEENAICMFINDLILARDDDQRQEIRDSTNLPV